MMSPGTLVNAIRSALAFVILPECFASFLSLATPEEIPKADEATIKIIERRKSLGFMIQVWLCQVLVPSLRIQRNRSSPRSCENGFGPTVGRVKSNSEQRASF